jgi:hypothetical protein
VREFTLQLNPGLRSATVGSTVRVRLQVVLSDGERSEISLEYPALVLAEHGWRRLVPAALDGLPDDAAHAAWQSLLRDAGIEVQPESTRRALDTIFFPFQRYAPDNVAVLVSDLPNYGHWTSAAALPELSALEP